MRYRPTVTVGITLLSALGLAGMADPAAAESWVEIPQVELSGTGSRPRRWTPPPSTSTRPRSPGGPAPISTPTSPGDSISRWSGRPPSRGRPWVRLPAPPGARAGGLPEGESSATDGGALDTYILAGGYGPPSFRLGLSTAWNKTTLPGDDGLSVNAGFQSFTNQSFAVGFVVENIQHPDFLGGQARPRYTYGLTIRAVPQLLTLNVQGSHLDGDQNLIAMLYGVRVALRSGWRSPPSCGTSPGNRPPSGCPASFSSARERCRPAGGCSPGTTTGWGRPPSRSTTSSGRRGPSLRPGDQWYRSGVRSWSVLAGPGDSATEVESAVTSRKEDAMPTGSVGNRSLPPLFSWVRVRRTPQSHPILGSSTSTPWRVPP